MAFSEPVGTSSRRTAVTPPPRLSAFLRRAWSTRISRMRRAAIVQTRAVLKIHAIQVHQPGGRLVHERRGLEGVVPSFASQSRACDTAQLLIDDGD